MAILPYLWTQCLIIHVSLKCQQQHFQTYLTSEKWGKPLELKRKKLKGSNTCQIGVFKFQSHQIS
jgi:hypothetical protein